MALAERVFSLETEYAVNFYADSGVPPPDRGAQALLEQLRSDCGPGFGEYLLNGSRLYFDMGHAEWALPECRSPREAAVYDKAADLAIGRALPAAEARLHAMGHHGRLVVVKNNIDSAGNTYGCHENYLMQRNSSLLGGEAFRTYIVQGLTAFLVTRQLFSGAGRVAVDDAVRFEMSQRASHIGAQVSQTTIYDRAIVSLAREGEPLAAGNRRRLHLILGDSNLSGWASWLKLGTTGLVLRMLEDLYLVDAPTLDDPVGAMHAVSRDLTGRAPLGLASGRSITPYEIQWHYYEAVVSHLESFEARPGDDDVLGAWYKALADGEADPMGLCDRVDWAIKKRMLDRLLDGEGQSWDGVAPQSALRWRLQATDLEYHQLDRAGGYRQLFPTDTLVADHEADAAATTPPPFTRARVRGDGLWAGRRDGTPFDVRNWDAISLGGEDQIHLADPLDFACDAVPETRNALLQALGHDDPVLRLRAARCGAFVDHPACRNRLLDIVRSDPEESIRKAAVDTLGRYGGDGVADALVALLAGASTQVRWHIEDALAALRTAKRAGSAPLRGGREPPPAETLVQIIS